jgi:hypothetical protein
VKLLTWVIVGNFALIAGSLMGCFFTHSPKCTGDRASEQLALITTQAFALYLGEK